MGRRAVALAELQGGVPPAEFYLCHRGGAVPETRANVVDGRKPAGQSVNVSHLGLRQGGGANPIFGYSIVRADMAEVACAMAQGCQLGVDGFGLLR